MTTVTYRDGVMCSDSKMTTGNLFIGAYKKVRKLKINNKKKSIVDRLLSKGGEDQEEVLVGCAGDVGHIQIYIEALFENGPANFDDLDASLIVAYKNGKAYTYMGGNMKGIPVLGEYTAIGSGMSIAMGALYQGATAEEAVEAAIHLDNYSGGDIQKVSFNDDK